MRHFLPDPTDLFPNLHFYRIRKFNGLRKIHGKWNLSGSGNLSRIRNLTGYRKLCRNGNLGGTYFFYYKLTFFRIQHFYRIRRNFIRNRHFNWIRKFRQKRQSNMKLNSIKNGTLFGICIFTGFLNLAGY